jgi:hypothetical protein
MKFNFNETNGTLGKTREQEAIGLEWMFLMIFV